MHNTTKLLLAIVLIALLVLIYKSNVSSEGMKSCIPADQRFCVNSPDDSRCCKSSFEGMKSCIPADQRFCVNSPSDSRCCK